MPLTWHLSSMPGKGPFTWVSAVTLDIYEIPFPGIEMPSSPWVGGYSAAPILYWLFAYGPLSTVLGAQWFLQPWGPFERTTEETWVARAQLGLTCMFIFHFARRVVESFLINKYTGKTRRLSDVVFSYYAMWGCLCDFSGSSTMMATFGAVTPPVFATGAAIFLVGQSTNAYCHHLLNEVKSRGGGEHVIPTGGPFDSFLMPHYTAEMVSWTGFAVSSGFNTASLTIWFLSLSVMQCWTHRRRLEYIQMYESGPYATLAAGGQPSAPTDPALRWGVFPGFERI